MLQMSITSSITTILCTLVACRAVQSLTIVDDNVRQLPTFTDHAATKPNEDKFVTDPSANVDGIFRKEGDMTFILNTDPLSDDFEAEGKRKKRNAVLDTEKLWPGGVVPYEISSYFDEQEERLILSAMKHWENKTCIRFRPKRSTDQYSIFIMTGPILVCQSFVGRIGVTKQPQGVTLGEGCVHFPTIVHELGHVIGFYHEHSRPDRDEHVEVRLSNVRSSARSYFNKVAPGTTNLLGYGYDYASIMHYGKDDFSSNGRDTIVAKNPSIPFGDAWELSPLDIAKTKKLYSCDRESTWPPAQTVLSPNTLSLPTGITCGRVSNGQMSGAYTSPGYPSYRHNLDCAYVIKVPKGYHIKLTVNNFNIETSAGCSKDYMEVYVRNRLISERRVMSSVFQRHGIQTTGGRFCDNRGYTFSLERDVDFMTVYFHTDGSGRGRRGLNVTFTAVDDDECESNNCHQCTNLPGGHECDCRDGYYHSAAAATCYDVNECAYSNGSCQHQCVNSGGSYRCECDSGYYLQADGKSCANIRPPDPCNDTGDRCIEWNNQNICSHNYYTGETCVHGYCRCVDNPNRDYCTCLYKSGECHIEQGSSTRVGTPTFGGASRTTYSCVANENCQYDVHVISNYESNGRHGFGMEPTTGTTNVNISVSGSNQGTKPLILVFVSYEPVRWILNIPSGVVIERVLLGSYYLDDSSVTGYSSQSVLNVERHSYQTLPSGYGRDDGGGSTDELLEYVVGRFGPVASFSGSYQADLWTLNIHQQTLAESGCPTDATTPPSQSSQPPPTSEEPMITSTTFSASTITTTPSTTPPQTTPSTTPPSTTTNFTPPPVQCGGLLTTSSGTFQTPNWPETYPNNMDCEWRIQLPDASKVVEIRCEEDPFGIAGTLPACSKDFLKFYDGHSKQDTEFGPFCYFTKPSTAVMSSNKAMAVFHSGPRHSPSRRGFKCSFQPLDVSGDPQCGGTLTAASGTFQTPNWPQTYPVNVNCTWTIILPDSSQRVELTFDTPYGIAGSLPTCKDKLYIYDDNAGTQYGPYCHFAVPNPPVLTSNKAKVKFMAGPSHNPSRVGFKATYRSVA